MTEQIPDINPDLDRMPSEGHAMSETMGEQSTGWRDISTVPYDEVVLFYTHDGNIAQDFMYDCGTKEMARVYTHWQPLPPPPGEEGEKDAAIAEYVHTIENLKGSLEVMRQGVARRDEDIEALKARCDKLEAAARDACEQLKSLAYASHKATGRPLSKRPRTKILQRPEKVRDNLLAVRRALRSVVDGGEQ